MSCGKYHTFGKNKHLHLDFVFRYYIKITLKISSCFPPFLSSTFYFYLTNQLHLLLMRRLLSLFFPSIFSSPFPLILLFFSYYCEGKGLLQRSESIWSGIHSSNSNNKKTPPLLKRGTRGKTLSHDRDKTRSIAAVPLLLLRGVLI